MFYLHHFTLERFPATEKFLTQAELSYERINRLTENTCSTWHMSNQHGNSAVKQGFGPLHESRAGAPGEPPSGGRLSTFLLSFSCFQTLRAKT